jgi:AraC family transcriptional regulator
MSPALLVHIQAHLDADLSLDVLSAKASLSPAHFQRTFQALVGETPRNYVARLRLERAAFRLLIHDVTLLDIALDCGFQNHETFTRAFRRRFGMPPSNYRAWVRTQVQQRPDTAAEQPDEAYSISETKIRRLHRAHLAFVRHVGPYEQVSDSLFDTLEDWATSQGLAGPRIWMGIGHDAPGTTRPEHLRFDAALVVPSAFTPRGPVGHQVFERRGLCRDYARRPVRHAARSLRGDLPARDPVAQIPVDRLACSGDLSDVAREFPPAVECDRHLSARGRFQCAAYALRWRTTTRVTEARLSDRPNCAP